MTKTKLEYTINTHYNEDDENFVIKYSRIPFSDDISSLRVRNTQYSKKGIEINIIVRFFPENKDKKNP